MSRRLIAALALLAMTAAACSSSAEADQDVLPTSAVPRLSSQEVVAGRTIENFFSAADEGNADALYALFTPHEDCRPQDIEAAMGTQAIDLISTPEFHVRNVAIRQLGTNAAVSFDLVEQVGGEEEAKRFEQFFPLTGIRGRLRLDANVCSWLTAGNGTPDGAIKAEIDQAISALQAYHAEEGDYHASANDLRYYESGLSIVNQVAGLRAGAVVLHSSPEAAVVVGQGNSGAWHCALVTDDGRVLEGRGPTVDSVLGVEECGAAAEPQA